MKAQQYWNDESLFFVGSLACGRLNKSNCRCELNFDLEQWLRPIAFLLLFCGCLTFVLTVWELKMRFSWQVLFVIYSLLSPALSVRVANVCEMLYRIRVEKFRCLELIWTCISNSKFSINLDKNSTINKQLAFIKLFAEQKQAFVFIDHYFKYNSSNKILHERWWF